MKKNKVAVLMGGFSSEREVSLTSGRAVVEALTGSVFDPVPMEFQLREELEKRLDPREFICVFNALHGIFGEDGQVQQLMEDKGVVYTGSGVRSSRLAMDKLASRAVFEQHNISVPLGYGLTEEKKELPRGFLPPLVVKPAGQGSSIGLSIIREESELGPALETAFRCGDKVLVEKFIFGRELTVGILEDSPLPIVEVVPESGVYDFHSKYTAGATRYKVPADLDEDTRDACWSAAVAAHRALGCRCFSRIDMILPENNVPIVLEVNTIPGMTATSLLPKAAAAVGIDFRSLCVKMVNAALAVAGKNGFFQAQERL